MLDLSVWAIEVGFAGCKLVAKRTMCCRDGVCGGVFDGECVALTGWGLVVTEVVNGRVQPRAERSAVRWLHSVVRQRTALERN